LEFEKWGEWQANKPAKEEAGAAAAAERRYAE
jgi:hypothetical protein